MVGIVAAVVTVVTVVVAVAVALMLKGGPAAGGLPLYAGATKADTIAGIGTSSDFLSSRLPEDLLSSVQAEVYTATGSVNGILNFYRTEMDNAGWTKQYENTFSSSPAGMNMTIGGLYFEKGDRGAMVYAINYTYQGESYTYFVLIEGPKIAFQGWMTTTTTWTTTTPTTTTTTTPTTTTPITTTPLLTTFELTGWDVVVDWDEDQTDGWADLEYTYSITSPVAVDLIDPNGESMALWSLSGYDILYETSGTSKISMTLGLSNTSPSPGTYRMIVYSLDAYGNPLDEIWENTFTFSGTHISIENASVSWDYVVEGTYMPKSVDIWVRNTGDLPAFGYYLRAWVDEHPIHFFTGAYYGWVSTGGPWFATNNSLQGLFEPGTYSLYIEWVKEPEKPDEEESLAASYDNNVIVP
jgi:hypothetical protein